MKLTKDIVARLLAFWTLSWFVITLLIFFIPIWITGLWAEPKRTKILLRITRIWMKCFFIIIGLRIKVKGQENFKKGTSYIVLCNHNSFMDVPVSTSSIPGTSKTIAKVEMSRIPIFGMIYKRGSVLVNRKSEESRKASYSNMRAVLVMGMHMCIYPEGTRNKSGQPLQPFHGGAFRLAEKSNHPIMPAVIFNTKKSLPVNKTFYYWPVKVEIHFLDPIESDLQTAAELKEKVFTIMKNYYLEHQV